MSEEVQLGSLVVVSLAAFVVPLLLGLFHGSRVPTVVGEVGIGVALGPSWLGLIEIGPWLEFLFLFGLAFLLFLAGLEIDFRLMRATRRGAVGLLESPLGIGLCGMAIRVAIAITIATVLTLVGLLQSPTLVALLLGSTSLGVVLSVLEERKLLREPYGQLLVVNAAVADFATVVLLTVLFSADSRSPVVQLALIGLLLSVAMALFAGLRGISRVRRATGLIESLAGSPAQIRIRGSLALLIVFVALAHELGLEIILGAFLAGAILSALSVQREDNLFQVKIHAVGYGFFIPVFFVVSGAKVDLPALIASSSSLALVPLLLLAVFVVKTVPAILYRQRCTAREALAGGLLQSAQLTLTIAGVEIGRRLELIDEALASALILVALLSVLIAPLLFARLLPERQPTPEVAEDSLEAGSL